MAWFSLASQQFSADLRTIKLVQLAVRRMTNVRTLRIFFGHPNLADALLRCFFDVRRSKIEDIVPVRRLWIEATRISAGLNPDIHSHPYGLPLHLRFDGLESVRLRYLPLNSGVVLSESFQQGHHVFRRHGDRMGFPDGCEGSLDTPVIGAWWEHSIGLEQVRWMDGSEGSRVDPKSPVERFMAATFQMNDQIYLKLYERHLIPPVIHAASLPHRLRAPVAYRGGWLDPLDLESCVISPYVSPL